LIEGQLRAGLVATAAAAVRHARDPWWVIGSAAVALHGADPGHVADIDLLTSAFGAHTLLAAAGARPDAASDHSRFRSAYGRWRPANGLAIEIMGGLQVNTVAGWQRVEPRTRVPVRCGAATLSLFIPGRGDLAAILRLFGRDKDLARAAALAAA
jgi:hypothetical protein